jgi:hypothetical protein
LNGLSNPYFQPLSFERIGRFCVESVNVPGNWNRSVERPSLTNAATCDFADDELRAVLDLVVVAREALDHRVARVVGPLDDVDEFAAKFVPECHVCQSSQSREW